MEEEQEVQSSKHVCKICDRRFSCGRALGGHMRIHGSQFNEDDGVRRRRVCATQSKNGLQEQEQEHEQEHEQEASCGGDHLEGKNNNPMYDLRPNRRRTWRYADLDYSYAAVNGEFGGSKFSDFKNFQTCGQCGEEFSSWKSLIRHMECHYDDTKADQQEEEEEEQSDDEEEEVMGVYWDSESDTERVRERITRTKGKRSNRTQRRPSPSSEVEFMANCLVMLASSGESWEPTIKPSSSLNRLDEECTTSRVRDLKRKRRAPGAAQDLKKLVPKKMKYQCKTCKKMFSSFQALGGHRASHNKVKGCSAKQDDDIDEEIITSDEDLSKDLGKSTTTPAVCDEEESIVLGSHVIYSSKHHKSPWLDLNLPAPDDDPKWFHPTQKQGFCSISTQ